MMQLMQMQTRKRRTFIKKQARNCLYNDWIMRILAFVVTRGCCVGVVQFGAAFSLAIEDITQNTRFSTLAYFVYLMLSLVILVPLVYGLFYSFIESINNEDKINLVDLFYAFGNANVLMRSYRLFVYTALKLFVCFLPALVLSIWCDNYYYSGIFGIESTLYDFDVVYFVIKTIVVVFSVLGFVAGIKNIVGVYVSIKREDKEIGECFFVARICCEDSKGELCACAISFVPLIVVSLFTFGFLYVMYTLPYILITFVKYSEYIYKKEMYTYKTQSVLYDTSKNENINQENINNED